LEGFLACTFTTSKKSNTMGEKGQKTFQKGTFHFVRGEWMKKGGGQHCWSSDERRIRGGGGGWQTYLKLTIQNLFIDMGKLTHLFVGGNLFSSEIRKGEKGGKRSFGLLYLSLRIPLRRSKAPGLASTDRKTQVFVRDVWGGVGPQQDYLDPYIRGRHLKGGKGDNL